MRDRPKRTTGALANVAVLERELGGVAYRLWRAERSGDAVDADLLRRRDDLLRLLEEENARLERLRSQRGDAAPG